MALQELLQSDNASAAEINARLNALRTARITAKAAMAKAQNDLRDLLTVRQEGVLVLHGMLE